MKVMISQPMNGKTEEQIRTDRAEAVARLQQQGHKVVDTIFDLGPDVRPETAPLKYLAKSIEAMADIDAVYFLRGWESAHGCQIERAIAQSCGKTVFLD
jgi:hypothetical protein